MKPLTTKQTMLLVMTVATTGSLFQCSGVVNSIAQVNPCGTILNCNPQFYNFVRGVEDPFCTYPPFCDGATDPVYGGGFGAVP